MRLAVVGFCAGLLACTAESPNVPVDPNGVPDDEPAYADVLVAAGAGTGLTTCPSLPVDCPPRGSCAEHASLGPPDGVVFALPSDGRLEVGFLCSSLRELGGMSPTPDFRIEATVPAGARAVVSVSFSGSDFQVVDYLDEMNRDFDLSRTGLEVARFVRIAAEGGEGIEIDAVEALR